MEAADEVLVVTTPDLPAVTDAIKLKVFADKFGTKPIGVVINRLHNDKHEMSPKEVAEFMDLPVLGKIPEDKNVRASLKEKTPVVMHKPRSKSSENFKVVAARIIGRHYKPRAGFLGWLR